MRQTQIVMLLALVACTGRDAATDDATDWRGTSTQQGDTTVVTTARNSGHPRQQVDSVQVIWRSDSLERPSQLALVGDSLLAVADGARIYLLSLTGAVRAILGSQGEGPGEFGRIGAMGVDGDAIVAVDQTRHSWAAFALDGRLMGSGRFEAAPERLINLQGGRLAIRDSALQLAWLALGDGKQAAMFAGIVSHPLSDNPPMMLTRAAGQPMIAGTQGVLMVRDLFGPYPRVAISPDGRHATGDGVEYCVDVLGGARARRFCREWQRIPVTEPVRHPDYAALATMGGRDIGDFGPLREVLDQAEVGAARNSYTGLHFDADGRLWVQVVDSLSANVHPLLMRLVPATRPEFRHYDLFNAEGRLVRELLLPSTFTPWDARGNDIYGLWETTEGDLAVAAIRL